jgi:hypothetical protein
MAPPDPFALGEAAFTQGRRLRVMDDYVVRIEEESSSILSIHFYIVLEHSLREVLFLTLQSIVKGLGRVEKFLVSRNDLPTGIQADILQQRHKTPKDLRHPTPKLGGINMQDPLPFHLLSQAF